MQSVNGATELTGYIKRGIPAFMNATGNFVHFEEVLPGEKTRGGLVIPAAHMRAFASPVGMVIAVGPECKFVKVGDVIVGDKNMVVGENFVAGYHWFYVNENMVSATLTMEVLDEQKTAAADGGAS